MRFYGSGVSPESHALGILPLQISMKYYDFLPIFNFVTIEPGHFTTICSKDSITRANIPFLDKSCVNVGLGGTIE